MQLETFDVRRQKSGRRLLDVVKGPSAWPKSVCRACGVRDKVARTPGRTIMPQLGLLYLFCWFYFHLSSCTRRFRHCSRPLQASLLQATGSDRSLPVGSTTAAQPRDGSPRLDAPDLVRGKSHRISPAVGVGTGRACRLRAFPAPARWAQLVAARGARGRHPNAGRFARSDVVRRGPDPRSLRLARAGSPGLASLNEARFVWPGAFGISTFGFPARTVSPMPVPGHRWSQQLPAGAGLAASPGFAR